MDTLFTACLLVFCLILGLGLGWLLRRPKASVAQTQVFSGLESFRSVGDLSVFKAVTKEIVTQSDHAFGEFGSKYLSWAFSKKKLVMIFEFEIDCRFDLRRDDFLLDITHNANNTRKAHITLPPCHYDLAIRNIQFYDEQRSKLLPWLLPDLVNGFFDAGFSETDKNKLIQEARNHASKEAHRLIRQFKPDVERSARSTLQALATGFGVHFVQVNFSTEAEVLPVPEVKALQVQQAAVAQDVPELIKQAA